MADAIRAGERDGERGVNGGAVPRLRPGFLGWAHPFIGVAAAAAVAMVLPGLLMMGSAAGSGAGSGALQTPPWTTLAQFSLLAVIVALVLFGARRKAARRRAETVPTATTATPVSPTASSSAADPTRPAPMLKSLLVVGVISIVFAIAVNLLLDTPGIESPKAIVNQLGLGKAAWSDLLIIAGVAMAAPIGEELALRGLVFRGIFDAVGRKRGHGAGAVPYLGAFLAAAIPSAVLFAVLHLNPATGQNVFYLCLGLLACVAYWWTGALTSAVWVHALTNTIGLAFALFAATNAGTWWHAVALVAAPLIAVAIMAPVGRLAGVPRA